MIKTILNIGVFPSNLRNLKYKQLQYTLLSIHNLPMNEQFDLLQVKFLSWKGKLEQVDDVTIIGIRI